MITREDKLWSAYLDGELSAAEASEFDQALTPQARDRLSGEMRFEKGLAGALGADAPCPGGLWDKVCADVRAQQQPKARKRTMTDWLAYGVTAVAASLFIAVGLAGYNWYQQLPEFLLLNASTLQDFKIQVAYETNDPAELSRFLKSQNFAVTVVDPNSVVDDPANHQRHVLGARNNTYWGEEVMEVYLDCCGLPAKVILVPKGGSAATAVGQAVAAGKIRDAKPVGDYVAALVTHHSGAGNMLDIVSADWEYALRNA